jgi:hypothetical protein
MAYHLLVTEPSICTVFSEQKPAMMLAGTWYWLDYFLCGIQFDFIVPRHIKWQDVQLMRYHSSRFRLGPHFDQGGLNRDQPVICL